MPAVQRVAIVGATGATGIQLASELVSRGIAVRVVSRSESNLARAFGERPVERFAADARDTAALGAAATGCDVVVDCIGLPPERMADHPVTARAVSEAARNAGARCLQVSSFWAFLPIRSLPLTEDHPREGGHPYVQMRRAAEDVMLAAGAAVVHLPDFFGPHVGGSTVQNPLEDAVAGRPMNVIGGRDLEREAIWVPDAMRLVADLMVHDEAYGRSWIFPGGGPLTPRRLAAIASEHLDRPVKVRAAGPTTLRLLSLFMKDLRQVMPIVPYYVQPIRFDASRLRALLGDLWVTPYTESIPETLDWLRAAGE